MQICSHFSSLADKWRCRRRNEYEILRQVGRGRRWHGRIGTRGKPGVSGGRRPGVVTYREQKEFDALKSEAGAKGSSIEGHLVDVTDEAAVRQLLDRVLAEHKRLDALVNTVGGYAGGVNLWEMETKVFDQLLALNLRSGYTLSRAAIPAMLEQKHGAIVNVAAKAAVDHGAGAAAYAASKAAALAMMDSLAVELKGSGVRVNSILPSIIDTEANRKAMPNADFAKWPNPHDIARVILFLCSDDAKVIQGAAVPVYGDS